MNSRNHLSPVGCDVLNITWSNFVIFFLVIDVTIFLYIKSFFHFYDPEIRRDMCGDDLVST